MTFNVSPGVYDRLIDFMTGAVVGGAVMSGAGEDAGGEISIPWPESIYQSTTLDSFSYASEDSTVYDIDISKNGDFIYLVGGGTNTIFQYALSSNYDLATVNLDTSFVFPNSEQYSRGVSVSDDGTVLILYATVTKTFYQYNLSTPYDISSATLDAGKTTTVADSHNSISLSRDGSFLIAASGTSFIMYSLSTPNDISTISKIGTSFSFSATEVSPYGVFLGDDGNKAYMTGHSSRSVHQFDMVVPNDISSLIDPVINHGIGGSTRGMTFSRYGEYFFVVNHDTKNVVRYQPPSND